MPKPKVVYRKHEDETDHFFLLTKHSGMLHRQELTLAEAKGYWDGVECEWSTDAFGRMWEIEKGS